MLWDMQLFTGSSSGQDRFSAQLLAWRHKRSNKFQVTDDHYVALLSEFSRLRYFVVLLRSTAHLSSQFEFYVVGFE